MTLIDTSGNPFLIRESFLKADEEAARNERQRCGNPFLIRESFLKVKDE